MNYDSIVILQKSIVRNAILNTETTLTTNLECADYLRHAILNTLQILGKKQELYSIKT